MVYFGGQLDPTVYLDFRKAAKCYKEKSNDENVAAEMQKFKFVST